MNSRFTEKLFLVRCNHQTRGILSCQEHDHEQYHEKDTKISVVCFFLAFGLNGNYIRIYLVYFMFVAL